MSKKIKEKLDVFLEGLEKDYNEDTTDRTIKGKGKAKIFLKTPQNGNIPPIIWIQRVSGSIDGFPKQLLPGGATIGVKDDYYNSVEDGDIVNVVFVPTFYTATNLAMDLEDQTQKYRYTESSSPKEKLGMWDMIKNSFKKVVG